MDKYLDKESKDMIDSVKLKQGVAKDSGNTYYYLDVHFINGYNTRILAFGDKQFAIQNALDQLETQKQVNSTF